MYLCTLCYSSVLPMPLRCSGSSTASILTTSDHYTLLAPLHLQYIVYVDIFMCIYFHNFLDIFVGTNFRTLTDINSKSNISQLCFWHLFIYFTGKEIYKRCFQEVGSLLEATTKEASWEQIDWISIRSKHTKRWITHFLLWGRASGQDKYFVIHVPCIDDVESMFP